jgi:hypothetical protein
MAQQTIKFHYLHTVILVDSKAGALTASFRDCIFVTVHLESTGAAKQVYR